VALSPPAATMNKHNNSETRSSEIAQSLAYSIYSLTTIVPIKVRNTNSAKKKMARYWDLKAWQQKKNVSIIQFFSLLHTDYYCIENEPRYYLMNFILSLLLFYRLMSHQPLFLCLFMLQAKLC
jgi:hypothetical protein